MKKARTILTLGVFAAVAIISTAAPVFLSITWD
jgi:hypothetical protein